MEEPLSLKLLGALHRAEADERAFSYFTAKVMNEKR